MARHSAEVETPVVHVCNCCHNKPKREASYVRGFIKLMAIVAVVFGTAYFTVPYWPI